MGVGDRPLGLTASGTAWWPSFRRGFAAMVPLWVGAVPVGIAYGAAAREGGLTPGEAQLMSLLVFSAAAQVSAVDGLTAGASLWPLIGTAIALNLHLPLLGLPADRGPLRPPSRWARIAAASVLTEGAYAVAAAGRPPRLPRLAGAGVSMYLAWTLATAIGASGGALLQRATLGLDLLAPLTFLAVLIPLIRTRSTLLTALSAAAAALLLARIAPNPVAVLGGGMTGGLVGAAMVVFPTGGRRGA